MFAHVPTVDHPGFSLFLQKQGDPRSDELGGGPIVVDDLPVPSRRVPMSTIHSPTTASSSTTVTAATPTDRLLTASLVVGPVLSLAADATYATRGWDDATAGLIHVLGAIAYGFVVLRIAGWLSSESRLAAAIVLTGLIGLAGNVAYGFEAIHMSFGDVQLVDRAGAANLIKPLGLFFPLSFVLIAAGLAALRHRTQAALVLAAMFLWPIAHIGNIAPLAVASNVILVVAFGSLARRLPD